MAAKAGDTLAGALGAAADLTSRVAGPLVDATRSSFTEGMHLAVTVGGLVTLAMSIAAAAALRDVRLDGTPLLEPPG